MSVSFLRCGRFNLSLRHPLVMGIVNITPDSFSDGGHYMDTTKAVAHARDLVEQGADIVDLGAESTRPGASPVSAEEELKRLLPVLKALRDLTVPISVDTMKPVVMRSVIEEGRRHFANNPEYASLLPGYRLRAGSNKIQRGPFNPSTSSRQTGMRFHEVRKVNLLHCALRSKARSAARLRTRVNSSGCK